jgi:hypothetical protein
MNKKLLFYSIIAIGWALIFLSYAEPTNITTVITYAFFGVAFGFLFSYMVIAPIYHWLFIPSNRTYWIMKGKHYARGLNIKLFFFKKEIEFEYYIDEKALQQDEGQINKVFGLSNIIPRFDSSRLGFSNTNGWANIYYYTYRKRKRNKSFFGYQKTNEWRKGKCALKKRAWIGYIHNPYHGGKIPSQENYYIKIRNVKLK